MSHPVPKDLLNLIVMVVAQAPAGMTLPQIQAALQPSPPDDLLLRAVRTLQKSGGLVAREGEWPACYQVPSGSRAAGPGAVAGPSAAPTPAAAPVASAAPTAVPAAAREPAPPAPTPPPVSIPAPAVAASAVATATATPDPAALVQRIFDQTIPVIIPSRLPAAASALLLQQAVIRLVPAPDRRAFLALLKAKLNGFTAEDSLAFGFDPEQYRAWRSVHDAVEPTSAGADAADVPADVPPTPVEARPAVPPTVPPAGPLPVPPNPPAARVRRPAADATPKEPELDIVKLLTLARPGSGGGPFSWLPTVAAASAGVFVRVVQRVVKPAPAEVVLQRILVSGIAVVVVLATTYFLDGPDWVWQLFGAVAACIGLFVGSRNRRAENAQP